MANAQSHLKNNEVDEDGLGKVGVDGVEELESIHGTSVTP
jgi:hypothetical protein